MFAKTLLKSGAVEIFARLCHPDLEKACVILAECEA